MYFVYINEVKVSIMTRWIGVFLAILATISWLDYEKDRKMETRFTNRLIHETSPYLLQHAHNPVDWYPWGEEALRKARTEDKPIFLSIGYSACHWCHVMEHECFEKEDIAALMNAHFINIKVDREERPDLDEIYMTAVQAMTGAGGWPMSVFLTPDLKPFYGGTYFPPRDMYGRPGFPSILQSVAGAYKTQRDQIDQSADSITKHIQTAVSHAAGEDELTQAWITQAAAQMRQRFDEQHGGFGTAPKFPHSMDISLLLRHSTQSRDAEALHIAEFTLRKMAEGGMYDQLGGGFHRYSVDEQWLIPHFEKMLYDNALLAKTYLEAWQLTKDPFYKTIVCETLDYILREMTAPDGSFYSTQDADSEGGEGAFFSWTPEQIKQSLGDKPGDIVCRYYGVDDAGNFEHGTSVLHVITNIETLAEERGVPVDDLIDVINQAKRELFKVRSSRPKPATDTKILTDWNGMMISSMALAGMALQEPRYLEAAQKACDFLLQTHLTDEGLLHTSKDGNAHTPGFLSDYALLANGLLDTYESSRNPRYLEEAQNLAERMIQQFWDEKDGAFFFTSNTHEKLIARSKNSMDSSVPSGNSIAALVLSRLFEMTGQAQYKERAQQTIAVYADGLQRYPSAFSQMLIALDFLLYPPKLIVMLARHDHDFERLQYSIFSEFLPNKALLYVWEENRAALEKLAPVIQGKDSQGKDSTVYVCENFTCAFPVHSSEDLMRQLSRSN
jgi:uncharacterized protein